MRMRMCACTCKLLPKRHPVLVEGAAARSDMSTQDFGLLPQSEHQRRLYSSMLLLPRHRPCRRVGPECRAGRRIGGLPALSATQTSSGSAKTPSGQFFATSCSPRTIGKRSEATHSRLPALLSRPHPSPSSNEAFLTIQGRVGFSPSYSWPTSLLSWSWSSTRFRAMARYSTTTL